jgi:ADP-ribosylglycohydrolase
MMINADAEYFHQKEPPENLFLEQITALNQEGFDTAGLDPAEHDGDADIFVSIEAFSEWTARRRARMTSWSYEEPSGLHEILTDCTDPATLPSVGGEYDDRVLAAWLGRGIGCVLGKPVEEPRWGRSKIEAYLRSAKAYPLADYIPAEGALPEGAQPHSQWGESTKGNIRGMPRDDDFDYTILNLHVLERYGTSLSTADVGAEWLAHLPFSLTYTAERAAYRNLTAGVHAEVAGELRNPYREWIGALIRADVFGYVLPGQPRAAAALAYRDAFLSHRGNGIYGAMWAAALISAAFASRSSVEALEAANREVPCRSRLHEAIQMVRSDYDAGKSWDAALRHIEHRWEGYSWIHVLNNAAALTAALLYGENDFGTTIGLAVQAGIDTDSIGATAGSVMGALKGTDAIEQHWKAPMYGPIDTAVLGFEALTFDSLAARTVALHQRLAVS